VLETWSVMMEGTVSNSVHGYPRAEVEAFLAAASAERVRLEAEIADAESRTARARSAVGSHRVMVAMLLDAQQELSEMRRGAELEAERILADAEREAQEIERAAARGYSVADAMREVSSGFEVPGAATTSVDAPVAVATAASPVAGPLIDLSAVSDSGDGYFDFLRGALTDERPLGPGPE
jgi:hypothetical protein